MRLGSWHSGEMVYTFGMIEEPDYVLAEFTVFPMYRRRHLAVRAAEMIFEHFKGRWEVKYNEKNTAAKALWNNVTAKYKPKTTRLNNTETVLSFCTNKLSTPNEIQ